MRKMLTGVSCLLLLTMLVGTETAYATAEDSAGGRLLVVQKTLEESAFNEEIIGENIQTRGNNPPSEYFDLSSGQYYYSISGMTNYAYTNHYFHPNSLGEIYITTSGLNTSGNSIRITLYRKRIIGKENIDSWTGNPQTIGGVIGQNLDPNELYFFNV